MDVDWQSVRSVVDCNRYMLDNNLCPDVVFEVGQDGQKMGAHKYVLSSRSSVFFAMFQGPVAETSSEIQVPDIQPDIFKTLLRYFYCGDVTVNPDYVIELLYAAKKYAAVNLADACVKQIQRSLTVNNACLVLEHAHMFDELGLQRDALRIIHSEAEKVLTQEDIVKLCPDCFRLIISSNNLQSHELTVWRATLRWAKEQCEVKKLLPTTQNLRAVLGDAVFCVRYLLISPQDLVKHVTNSDIFTFLERLHILEGAISGKRHHEKFSGEPRKQPKNSEEEKKEDNEDDDEMCSCVRLPFAVGRWVSSVPEIISFRCNKPIALHGFAIYGAYSEQTATYRIHALLYDENRKPVSEICRSFSEMSRLVSIFFSSTVRLKPLQKYTLSVKLEGVATFRGEGGRSKIKTSGVVFNFESPDPSWLPRSKSRVDQGQIPQLFFTVIKDAKSSTNREAKTPHVTTTQREISVSSEDVVSIRL